MQQLRDLLAGDLGRPNFEAIGINEDAWRDRVVPNADVLLRQIDQMMQG